MESITVTMARRLALARAGLLKFTGSELPARAAGRGQRARRMAHAVVEHFGYLQLDSVAVAGARSHSIVLASRLEGIDASLGETLLAPGEPLFEYWGHEACWLPMSLYPCFGFRRREFRVHPWWGDLLNQHRKLARGLLRRIEREGPLRSLDMEGRGGTGWWDLKLARRVTEALWSAGKVAVRERHNFQRSFDLVERVIPESARTVKISVEDSLDELLLRALAGHGWATPGTLAATWRLVKRHEAVRASLERLRDRGEVMQCTLETPQRDIAGWVRVCDLELAHRLRRIRPRRDRGVLLSPFDPVLWDRQRVQQLFDFEQRIEIYKPAAMRQFGYYCLPVLAGDRLIGRVDLKADRKAGRLRCLSRHFEAGEKHAQGRATMRNALERFARSVDLELVRTPA